MAKKRKAPKSFEQRQPTKSARHDLEETFDDSEDEFYAGRDKILLDESADGKRRRRLEEQEVDLQPSEEEILPYQDGDDLSDYDDEVEIDDEDGYDDNDLQLGGSRLDRSQDDEEAAKDEEESEEGNWGTTRADYYGDDAIETEEQAKEEENEAKRLHLKQLKGMTDADFGFDEDEWVSTEAPLQSRSTTEKLPDIQIPEAATDKQRLDLLKSRYPEFLPLVDEFAELERRLKELEATSTRISEQIAKGAQLGDGFPVSVKRNALLAYMASVTMYFAILASNVVEDHGGRKITAMTPFDLHEHSVIQTLSRARQLWEQVVDEPVAEPVMQAPTMAASSTNGISYQPPVTAGSVKKEKKLKKPLQEIENSKSNKSTLEGNALDTTSKTKKPRSKDKQKALEISDLLEDTKADASDSGSEMGDERPLTEEQYVEKTKKRKSLRFYTSQIAMKANKRGHASREARGDDDLPYKERNRDRQERLLREAQARGNQQPDFDNFENDDDYEEMPTQPDQNEEYYNQLLNAKDKKKADKQARANAYARAANEGATVYEEETVGPDGKRAITYAIAKNKGLMPKRKKEVRNPRVKKKKKYEEKMKKLGSIRQVYKGGEGKGGYGGELTGIKTNLVKGVKL